MAGEQLDRDTRGRWVAEELLQLIAHRTTGARIVVDAVLVPEQIEAVRTLVNLPVYHIHLKAPTQELESRYSRKRAHSIREFDHYSDVVENDTETNVGHLSANADLVVDTSITPLNEEVELVLKRLDRRQD